MVQFKLRPTLQWQQTFSLGVLVFCLLTSQIRADEDETTVYPSYSTKYSTTPAPSTTVGYDSGSSSEETYYSSSSSSTTTTTVKPPKASGESSYESKEDPYLPYPEHKDRFEVIDVAGHTQGQGQAKQTTGETTKYYTTGDVNDDFWLKHLGDDFKNAIHLQVGGNDQYENVYNVTKYNEPEVHHEYLTPHLPMFPAHYEPLRRPFYPVDSYPSNAQSYYHRQPYNPMPVKPYPMAYKPVETETHYQKPETPNHYEAKTDKEYDNEKDKKSYTKSADKSSEYEQSAKSDNKYEHSEQYKENEKPADQSAEHSEHHDEKHDKSEENQSYEAEFKIDDNGIDKTPSKYYQTKHQSKASYKAAKKYSASSKAESESNTEYESEASAPAANSAENSSAEKYGKTKKYHSKNEADSYATESEFPPVVVNLPDTETAVVDASDKNETPLVVKMPPVIYHSRPAYHDDDKQSYSQSGESDNVSQKENHSYQSYSQQQQQQTQNSYENTYLPQTPQYLQNPINSYQYNSHYPTQTQHYNSEHSNSEQHYNTPHSSESTQNSGHDDQKHYSSENLPQIYSKYKPTSFFNPPPYEESTYNGMAYPSYYMNRLSMAASGPIVTPTSTSASSAVDSQSSSADIYDSNNLPSHLSYKQTAAYNNYVRPTRSSRYIYYKGL